MALLYIGPNETGITMNLSLNNVNEPYSIIGVEIIYTKSADTNLKINLNSWKTETFTNPKKSDFIENYSNFNCDYFDTKFY